MNLKRLLFFLILVSLLASCGSARRSAGPGNDSSSRTEGKAGEKAVSPLAFEISENAKRFLGTRYQYGGTTKKGIDCSGLIYTAFQEENISLPRVSRDMSLQGERLFLKEVNVGDLLFFETNKNRKVINHVGLVVEVVEDELFFIHSSTSRGVIISSLNNSYWREHFVMARRVLLY